MGGGGGAPDLTTQTGTTSAQIPPELREMFTALANQITGVVPYAGRILTGPGGLVDPHAQEVAGMGPQERQWRQEAMSMLGGQGLTGAQREARQGLRQFTQGELGQSPATLAAMQAFKAQQLPSILSGSAVSGLGQGAIAEAAAQATQQAYVPLMQQEMQNRLAAQGQLANLGAQGYAQQVGLQGIAGMPREIRDRRAQAVYQDILRQQNLATGMLLGPFGRLAQPGQTTESRTVNTGGGK
jgi:hypothetical protein